MSRVDRGMQQGNGRDAGGRRTRGDGRSSREGATEGQGHPLRRVTPLLCCRALEQEHARQRAAVYVVSTLASVSGSPAGAAAAGHAGAAKVASLCLRWQLTHTTGVTVLPEGAMGRGRSILSSGGHRPRSVGCERVCAECLGANEVCLICTPGRKATAALVPSAAASVATLRNLARLKDGPRWLSEAAALRPLVLAVQFGDSSLREAALAALHHMRRSSSSTKALGATAGVVPALLGTLQEDGVTAGATRAAGILADLAEAGLLCIDDLCKAEGCRILLGFLRQSVKARHPSLQHCLSRKTPVASC